MKQCIKCRMTKDESAFYPNRTRKDGLHNTCIQCQKNIIKKIKNILNNIEKQS